MKTDRAPAMSLVPRDYCARIAVDITVDNDGEKPTMRRATARSTAPAMKSSATVVMAPSTKSEPRANN